MHAPSPTTFGSSPAKWSVSALSVERAQQQQQQPQTSSLVRMDEVAVDFFNKILKQKSP